MASLTGRFLIFLSLFFRVLPLCAVPAAAWADTADKVVALVSIKTPPSLVAKRAAIESKITTGLREAHWDVIGLADVEKLVGSDKYLLGCTGEVCSMQLVRATKARYFVWGDITEKKREYAIILKFFDGTKGDLPMAGEYAEVQAKSLTSELTILATTMGHEAARILEESAHPDVIPGGEAPLAAVVSVKVPTIFQNVQDKMESGVGRGLELAGWHVANVFESIHAISERQDLVDCTSGACMSEIARMARAPYLVRAEFKTGKSSKYKISAYLFDAAYPNQPMVIEEEEGSSDDPFCPPVGMLLARAARELGRKALRTVPPMSPSQAAPVTTATNATPSAYPYAARPQPDSSADRIPFPEPTEHKLRTGWLIAGLAAAGVGAFLIGDSIYYFHTDRQGVDCEATSIGTECWRRYHDGGRGYLALGLGAASALVGAYILVFPAREHSTTVALTPRGISLRREF